LASVLEKNQLKTVKIGVDGTKICFFRPKTGLDTYFSAQIFILKPILASVLKKNQLETVKIGADDTKT
jgi:hypothetical protein